MVEEATRRISRAPIHYNTSYISWSYSSYFFIPMIAKAELLKGSRNKIRDGKVLCTHRRYATAVYITGYAIEMALKYSICWLFRFRQGFPETPQEFNIYVANSSGLLRKTIKDIWEIRNHDLSKLLFHSGEEQNILNHYHTEWQIVQSWQPEMRYSNTPVTRSRAVNFLNAAEIITKKIIR